MNILIVGALDPFDNYKEKELCKAISAHYRETGHKTDICYLPFKTDFHDIHRQMLAYRLLTVFPASDLLITVGYPAFAVHHPNKFAFLFELLPEFHTQYNTEYGYKPLYYRADKDQRYLNSILEMEKVCLQETKGVYAASDSLRNTLQPFGCAAERFSFAAPLSNDDATECCHNAVLIESYLEPMDRLDILLDAMTMLKGEHNLQIYVPTADAFYLKAVQERIGRLQLDDTVTVIEGRISHNDVKNCRGVVCLRRSSGYIPFYMAHAYAMGVPSVVCADGGALCELEPKFQHHFTSQPTPQALAVSLKKIFNGSNDYSDAPCILPNDISHILERLVK